MTTGYAAGDRTGFGTAVAATAATLAGLLFVAAAILTAIVFGLINAWVLLVEIMR